MRAADMKEFSIDKERLVKTLQSLVRIPSFVDSIEVSGWVKKEMEGIGYHVDSDKDGNLIAEIGKGPGFLLNAHLDTVGPGDGWRLGPFSGAIENGRVYGRGSTDCKSGVAAMIEIARILKGGLKKRVVFAFTAFEEGYPPEKRGAYKIAGKLANIEKGLIVEPTYEGSSLKIYTGCRGNAKYSIDIIGTRGHSAMPGKSDNPIFRFPALLDEIRRFPTRSMEIKAIGKQISDSITVTEICAKEGYNVIPGRCSLTLDRRSLPDEKPGDADEAITRSCKAALGNRFELRRLSATQGYYFNDADFLSLCRKSVISRGLKPTVDFLLAGIDGAVFYNIAGIGTFMLGPGTDGQEHTIDEYCDLEGLYKGTEAVLAVIRSWDGSG